MLGLKLIHVSKTGYWTVFFKMAESRETTVASFTKEVNPRLAKRPLKTNVRLTQLIAG